MTEIYTMFHGTSTIHLDNILKFGLLAHPKKKYWDTHIGSTTVNPTRKSLSGVYFSSSVEMSASGACNSCSKFGGDHMFIAANIDPSTAVSDEDSISSFVDTGVWYLMRQHGCNEPSKFLGIIESNEKIKDKIINTYTRTLHFTFTKNNDYMKHFKELKNAFYSALNRILSHSYNDDKKRYMIMYYNGHKYCKYPTNFPESVELAEDNYLNTLDVLTCIYTQSTIKFPGQRNHSLRILDNVEYSGINKIILIVSVNPEGKTKIKYVNKNETIGVSKAFKKLTQHYIL